MTNEVRSTLMSHGTTLEAIAKYEAFQKKMNEADSGERWEQGTITARRLGDIVCLEKLPISIRYAGSGWRSVESIKEDGVRSMSELKGLRVPETLSKSQPVRDYSNGSLVSSVGRFKANGGLAADIDREASYQFPMTVGNGILAVPLSDLPLDKICSGSFAKASGGVCVLTRKVSSNGHEKDQVISIDEKSGKFLGLEESSNGVVHYMVKASSLKSLDNGVSMFQKVIATQISGFNKTKVEETTYTLEKATFGNKVNIEDMRSLGPKGTEAMDNRLKQKKSVRYSIGDTAKSDEDVKSMSDRMRENDPPEGPSLMQGGLVASGCAVMGGGVLLAFRVRKRAL